ncbi:MAG: hypothetical protein N4A41_00425 [Crocinitomicaceae bacterium]|jgi:hypothetical protein|nr:hypothetical protein [Crocinitomicaceae bacterium]
MAINIKTATMWDLTDDRKILAKAMDVSIAEIDSFKPSALSEIGRLLGLKNTADILGDKEVSKQASGALDAVMNE